MSSKWVEWCDRVKYGFYYYGGEYAGCQRVMDAGHIFTLTCHEVSVGSGSLSSHSRLSSVFHITFLSLYFPPPPTAGGECEGSQGDSGTVGRG